MPFQFNPFTGKLDYYVSGGTGPTGPAGQNGTPGADGQDGEDAWFGPQGNQGIPGSQGIQGVQGIPGVSVFPLDGEDGQDGYSIVGPQGAQGTQGNPGTNGTIGVNGAPGADGQDGDDASPPLFFLNPAGTVVSGTTPSQTASVGISINYAREDHTHGTPAAGASGPWTYIQNSTLVTDTLTVPVRYQFLCARTFNNVGAIVNNGDFVIIH